MTSKGPRTRHKSESKFREFIGGAKDFNPTEAPTLRDVIMKVLQLREMKVATEEIYLQQVNMVPIFNLVASDILAIWAKANPQLSPPVVATQKAITKRINQNWTSLVDACYGRLKQKNSDIIVQKLDKLFDISKCKCKIILCSDKNSPCNNISCDSQGAHIECSCSKTEKLPKLDLIWIKCQREKTGTLSKFYFGLVDGPESKRIEKMNERKSRDQERLQQPDPNLKQLHKPYTKIYPELNLEENVEEPYNMIEVDINSVEKDDEETLVRNRLNITNAASATIRYL